MSVNYFEMPANMDSICRLCLSESSNLTAIFNPNEDAGESTSLPQKIQSCGAIEIRERDGLPSLICDVCVYKANVAYEFRQQCQHSDARLRLYYNKPARSKFTNASVQTNTHTNIILAKTINSQANYFVKQEIQGLNADLPNTIEVYQTTERIEVDDNITTDIDGNQMATAEKLFLCNIEFDGAKEIEKGAVIIETHQDSEQTCVANTAALAIESTIESDHNLQENQSVTIISDMKNVPTDEYISEHLLTAVSTDDNEEDDTIIEGEEVTLIEQNILEHEENTQDQIEQDDDSDAKWVKNSENESLSFPKRSTRKAKSIIGKSYNVDEIDEEDSHDGNEKQKFKCKVCSKRYSTHKGLQNHSLVHHKVHKCATCMKAFYKIENLEKHQKIHESKPFACQICHTCFAKSQSLARHLKIHSDKSNVDNLQGDNNNDNDNDNRMDMKPENDTDDDDHHNYSQTTVQDEFGTTPGLYKCGMCNQFCSTLKNLKRHALVHGEKKYSCTVCKKWFFRPDTLKKHAEKHGHGLLDNLVDENKLYESDDESFNRTSSGDMSNVSNSQTNSKKDESDDDGSGKYKCQHCDKVMATKTGLRRHVSMHKPKAEPVTCEICKKVCASQARLVLHQKTHNKPKEKVPREYLCHICSKVYPSNSSLTYHMRTHSGVKPHVCKTCNSGFTTTTSLANHIRIHTGDKPFVCHVCSAAFAVSSAFRRHLTRHTGEANYLCKTCGKAFKRLSTLKEHTYTHSGEKPYVCKTCGAAYSHSGSLFAHQKRCKAQYGEILSEDPLSHVTHHIHVNVESPVRPLAFIGPTY